MSVDESGAPSRAPRAHFFLSAEIVPADGAVFTARVRNLSAGGMMIECSEPLRAGQQLCARLRGIGAVAGRVAWVRGGRAGIAFAHQIDPELARRPVQSGDATPDYVKPIIVSERHLSDAAKQEPEGRLD